MGLEVFMPLIIMAIAEAAKALMRYYRIEPPPSLTPTVAVTSGAGLGLGFMEFPTLQTLPHMPLWFWVAFGVLSGFAAVGLHQTWRLLMGTRSRRLRRCTDCGPVPLKR